MTAKDENIEPIPVSSFRCPACLDSYFSTGVRCYPPEGGSDGWCERKKQKVSAAEASTDPNGAAE